jgi:hypothetical protein
MRLNFQGFEFENFADPKLIQEFVAGFSRFEYALKLDRWLKSTDDASANWDKFASFLRTHFNKARTAPLKRAADYILEHPPQKQICNGNTLGWSPGGVTNMSDLEALLRYVRRIRNNLFHGGKSQPGSPMEIDRNAELLQHGMIILAECLELCKTHRPSFVEHFEAH